MINQVKDSKTFLEITDKLEKVPNNKIKQSSLYNYMISGLYNKKTFTFVSNENNKMNGCIVLTLGKDLNFDLILSIIFLWISPQYRKLWKSYMRFIEETALEFKCKKISFTTSRNEKAIERQMGKYGYKKVYNVIEKEMI